MNDALPFLLKELLVKEHYKINYDELKLQLLSHPSYPSLHSLTGVLDHFNIENTALEVPTNIETLKQLPTSFLSFIDSKEFVIVNQFENSVELIFSSQKKKKYSIDDFLSIWSGVILVVEKENNESTAALKVPNTFTTNILQILCGVFMVGLFFYAKPSFFEMFYFALSLIGIGISVLILKHELGFQSKAVAKICTKTETTSCNEVLNSKGASFMGFLKLSDLSVIYFSALAIATIMAAIASVTYDALITISFLAIPITIYSIYYQFKVVKKWCPLCLMIVAVLWAQACCIFIGDISISSIKFDLISNFILFFSLILTAAGWLFIKPLLKKQQEFQKLEIDHYKFKRNISLFKGALLEAKTINTNIDVENEIVLGSKNAPIQLLLVTSPSCFYCRAAHTDVEKIRKKYPNEVSLMIRFSVPDDASHIANKVSQRLLESYNNGSLTEITDNLHSAYEEGVDLEQWISLFGESNTDYSAVLKAQKEWCHEHGINFTPALYINGKQYPRVYDRSDLSYFIEDLSEAVEQTQTELNVEMIN